MRSAAGPHRSRVRRPWPCNRSRSPSCAASSHLGQWLGRAASTPGLFFAQELTSSSDWIRFAVALGTCSGPEHRDDESPPSRARRSFLVGRQDWQSREGRAPGTAVPTPAVALLQFSRSMIPRPHQAHRFGIIRRGCVYALRHHWTRLLTAVKGPPRSGFVQNLCASLRPTRNPEARLRFRKIPSSPGEIPPGIIFRRV